MVPATVFLPPTGLAAALQVLAIWEVAIVTMTRTAMETLSADKTTVRMIIHPLEATGQALLIVVLVS